LSLNDYWFEIGWVDLIEKMRWKPPGNVLFLQLAGTLMPARETAYNLDFTFPFIRIDTGGKPDSRAD
jgi:hypothetical protein